MSLNPDRIYTPEEYLKLERQAEYKSEYFAGEIFAMSGASKNHNIIVTNIVGELCLQFKGRPCLVFSSDMRVKINSTGLYTYPDIVALCHKDQYDDDYIDTLLNPSMIVEVLSKSTEAYDRGDKFAHYRKLDSLKEYVLVTQDKYHVELYTRQSDNHWLLSEVNTIEGVVSFESIKCHLALNEIYDKVEIES